jgi:hypothetical protein
MRLHQIHKKEFIELRPDDGRGFAWGKYNVNSLKNESKYKRYKPLFKNQNRTTLFNAQTHFYNNRDRLMLAASSETFIDYFNTPSEGETQPARPPAVQVQSTFLVRVSRQWAYPPWFAS